MLINNRFAYQALDRVTNDDGTRFYTCPKTGKPLPSVTTVLSHTADKTAIKLWEEWVGERRANAARKQATNLGTHMHLHLECHIQGVPRPGGNNLVRVQGRRMADIIIEKCLTKVDEVWGWETPLYFPDLYAGTTDLIGVYDGKPAIMDYKTAKKIRTREQIGDYFCQGAAYALAHNYHYGTDIDRVVIFMVSRDLRQETFILEGKEFVQKFEEWADRLATYQNDHQ